MFPVDSLPPQYCEERGAAEAAKRLAEQQKKALEAVQTSVTVQHNTPSSLAQTIHPPLSKPVSPGVLGSIFHGFAKKTTPAPSSPASSAAPSRTQTPVLQASSDREKAELEAKRDADICALPGWH